MFDDIKFDKILKNWWTEFVQKDLVIAALVITQITLTSSFLKIEQFANFIHTVPLELCFFIELHHYSFEKIKFTIRLKRNCYRKIFP